MKITKKTKMSDLIEKYPKSAEILFKAGLSCVGCPMVMQETIEDGCLGHGFTEKDIEKLIKKLNEKK